MKKVLDKYIFSEISVGIVFMMITILTIIQIVHVTFGQYIKLGLVYGLFILLVVVIKDKFKFVFTDKTNIILLAFFICYGISIVLNRGSCFAENVKAYVYMLVFFLLFFMLPKRHSLEQNKENLLVISVVLALTTGLYALVSFITYLFGITKHFAFEEADGAITTHNYIGFMWGRLYGLSNPNNTAMISLLGIFVSIFLFWYFKKKFLRIVLILNVLINYCCLLLTVTRTSYYCLLIVIAFSSFLLLLNKNSKDGNKVKAIGKSLMLATIIVVLIVALSSISLKLLPYFPMIVGNSNAGIASVTSSHNANVMDTLVDTKVDVDSDRLQMSDNSSLTERVMIWESTFKEFANSPIFGLTREGLVEPVYNRLLDDYEYVGDGIITGGPHNIYITVLASSGIVGFLLAVILVILVIIRFVKAVKKSHFDLFLFFSFIICLSFFITECFESRILYQVTFFNVVFWLFFGYLSALSKEMIIDE